MKKNFLFMSVLASLFMAGCSQEEIAPNDDGNGGSNTSYMAVNLVSSDVTGSRVAEGYEDGSKNENHVTKVRFYFFNSVGTAVNVKLTDNVYVNYYDWTPNTADDPDPAPDKPDQKPGSIDNDDIESKLNAVIVINTANGDKVPQRIAAVLNPTSSLLDDGSKSLTELKNIVEDYAITGESSLTSKGKFVMFNAVYKGNNNAQVSTALIENKNLCKTEDEAKDNPVTIYVERSVAKVRVTLDNSIGIASDNKLALKDKDDKALTVGGQQVYLQLDGWDLTAETSEGRLVKKINPQWPDTWVWHNDHRSFWAINSMTATNKYYDYNAINTSFGKDYALYTNENAQLNDAVDGKTVNGKAQNHTKVILKGQLCKKGEDNSYTPFTIVRHLGVYFADTKSETEAENFPQLKKSILEQLNASGNTYYCPKTDGSGRKQIDAGDIKIVVVDQEKEENSDNNCYICAQLTDAAANKTWYNASEEGTIITAAEINGKLKYKKGETETNVVDKALVWNDGMTYYYYTIKHLKDSNQEGVVRNHVYDTKVTKIAGLGTPVYDPKETIYPEKPDPYSHYIAAQINILSWRIVSNDYQLEW